MQIYGIGSKISLLQDFCHEILNEHTFLLIDAFQPSVNIRTIFHVRFLFFLH